MKSIIIKTFCLLLVWGALNAQESITLEGIWKNYDYVAKSVPGFRFMNDGKHYTRLEDNVIKKYDLTTGDHVEDILDGASLKDVSGFDGKINSYKFNGDESQIILASEVESIYRRSSKAYYYTYDRSSKNLKSVRPGDKVMYATLSPDGALIAYVFENNLYYSNLAMNITKAVTQDGEFNKIINGATDWVYEEEFAFAKAFYWSPDSKKLAYLRFDESEVKEFTMTNYKNGVYPEYVTFKYPKVGEANAKVSVHIYNAKDDRVQDVDMGAMDDMYIPRVKWTKDANKLCVFKMNRHQNHLELFLADAKSGKTSLLLEEKNKYYIDITDDLDFLDDGKHFIWTDETSGYKQVYVYDMKGNKVAHVDTGEKEIMSLYGVDEKRKKIFYQVVGDSPMEREICSANLDGTGVKVLQDKAGFNRAQFSSNFDYYVNNYSNINEPSSYIVYENSGKEVREIETNQELKTRMADMNIAEVEFFDFKTSEDVKLNGYIMKPNDFDPNKEYPLFMYLYGGPGSQQVTDSWKGQNYWWFQMLLQEGFIVACVDNRGTGGRGEEFKKMTYQNLGHYETIDQIEAAKYLGSQSYIDKERIGIFGWSYGGYMSSLCLLKGNDVFDAAIAVAPVTSWKWYDTIYTERYMRTHAENEAGYEENSPINFADRLQGDYLLVHGMGDDNVHFQNTAEMANALINANKQFDTYYYPNRNHGIYGGVTRMHLYQKMTNFLRENLCKKEDKSAVKP